MRLRNAVSVRLLTRLRAGRVDNPGLRRRWRGIRPGASVPPAVRTRPLHDRRTGGKHWRTCSDSRHAGSGSDGHDRSSPRARRGATRRARMVTSLPSPAGKCLSGSSSSRRVSTTPPESEHEKKCKVLSWDGEECLFPAFFTPCLHVRNHTDRVLCKFADIRHLIFVLKGGSRLAPPPPTCCGHHS